MPPESIVVQGARENKLKNVSLAIPKRRITVFTGVSGSGKSSLVFDTIGAEAQRQPNETYSMFIRNRLPKVSRTDADAIEHISAAIVVDQKRLGGGSRSTVGTITDIFSILRVLFSRVGKPWVGYAFAFSFNEPAGMCPECSGIGKTVELDLDAFFDTSKSLNEGAMRFPAFAVGSWSWRTYASSGRFDNDKKLADYTEAEWRTLLHGKSGTLEFQSQAGPLHAKYEGVVDKFTRLYLNKDVGGSAESTRQTVQRFVRFGPCPLCHGARLNQAALSCKIDGRHIADFAAMEVEALLGVVAAIDDPLAAPMVAALTTRLRHVVAIGLGYLSLDRETATLSGGESQRIKMVRHLSSSLTDIIYVFDEPSVGLHPRDVHPVNELLQRLRDKGNTVLVVEHDRDVIGIADHVVDLGPHAGTRGGEVVYEGTVDGLAAADTPTGRSLKHELPLKTDPRRPTGHLTIADATLHNLKRVTVDIPTGVLTVVTGVAGSGKSTLINDVFLGQHPEAIAIDQSTLGTSTPERLGLGGLRCRIAIDQSTLGTSTRSNPATYVGIMDEIRRLFARANNVSASLFSFNSKGACENCRGLGVIYTDLVFLEPVKTTCEICGGRRFKDEVLGYRFRAKSITDVLAMTAGDALEFFAPADVRRKLAAVRDVGLDYLTLGQPLSTLSGGECQRMKLASELHKQGSVYVLDEPTTGLHMSDVGRLLALIDRLVDGGNSVIVIEYNLDVVKNADWIIDLGPKGGHRGGEIVFQGTPRDILSAEHSATGAYLRR